MNVSTPYNNPYSRSKTDKYKKCIDVVSSREGIKPLNKDDKPLKSAVFNIVKRLGVTNNLLYGYFVGVDMLSKPISYFKVLELCFVSPYRNATFYSDLMGCNHIQINRILSVLLELNYIVVVKKPRKIMLLNKFTIDTTYVVTKKGKQVISDVYEVVGLI
jgi:hypothetical protein